MTNEIQVLQNELIIAQQKSEIMTLKFQLEKSQAEKASRLEDSLFAPALFEHYQKVAEILSKSNVIPKDYKGKPEDIFVAMAMGYQLGFPVEQALQDIAVINGRPSVWGDGLLALALSHPDCESITEEPIYDKNIIIGYECTVKRKGHKPHTKSFTLENAKKAGLLGKPGPWTQYTERMLQMRARQAIKDKFADKLRGLRVVEIDEYIEGEFSEVEKLPTIQGETQTERLKSLLNINTPNVGTIIEETDVKKEQLDKHGVYASSGGTGWGPSDGGGIMIIEKSISPESLNKIEILMEEENFDEKRKESALRHFKVEKFSNLTEKDAEDFLKQFGRI